MVTAKLSFKKHFVFQTTVCFKIDFFFKKSTAEMSEAIERSLH